MAANLVDNVRNMLEGCAVRSVYGWTDSMVALYWMADKGSYKHFVANRVKLIKAKNYIQWGDVSLGQNPADLGEPIQGTTGTMAEGTRLAFQTRNVASISANRAQ